MKLTDIQFGRAWKLASHFGHEWAYCSSLKDTFRTPEEIRDRTIASRSDSEPIAGIEAPEVRIVEGFEGCGDLGYIVHHTTGTGRVHWEIWPCGIVDIEVSRPQGVVLKASVGSGNEVSIWRCDVNIPFARRHMDALGEIFEALGITYGGYGVALSRLSPDLITFTIEGEGGMSVYSISIDIPAEALNSQNWKKQLGSALMEL